MQASLGLLFIRQMIYEHGDPWWIYIDRVNLIRPPELSDNPTSIHLVDKLEELANEIMNFALRSISFIHRRNF
jgi:hypothetical protein